MKKIFILFSITLLLIGCKKVTSNSDPDPDTELTGLNQWIYDYMEQNYLWNVPVRSVELNSSLEYDEFLNSLLTGVAAQGNVNKDDGVWEDGERKYFYSYITEKEAQSRAGKSDYTSSNYGIYSTLYAVNPSRDAYVIFVMGVEPNSPADKLGMKRGDVITRIDDIKYYQYDENALELMLNNILRGVGGNRTLEWGEAVYSYDGDFIGIENLRTDIIVNNTYLTTPIWSHEVLYLHNSPIQVGYLNYKTFDLHFDDELIDIFAGWKTQNITEIVLDLRYNGGGHVVSSALLGTLIIGESKRGGIFSRTSYNAERTLTGRLETDYRIGDAETPSGTYEPIYDALGASLSGVETVYMLTTNSTASSSENLINGLRGLGIDVRLIGETTNGKNVGMESVNKDFNGYSYEFLPITFYMENAVGFLDYSKGFEPNVELNQFAYYPYDFGNQREKMLAVALQWITTGVKPVITKSLGLTNLVELRSPERSTGMIQVDLSKN